MKRRTIGICVTGYDWECESRVVYGIYKRCMELDINILVFSNLMRRPELNLDIKLSDDVVHGETEIYNLINYSLLDGIVIFGDSILDEAVLFDVCEKAEKAGIPVINVNDLCHDVCKNIILSNENAMESVVRHLVEDHGLTEINFISGFKNNAQSEERLGAYRKVLEEHGIPFEEERVAYGEFWKKSYECTEQIIASGQLPQAIVCANDTMAFFCMDCLKAHGYSIPEDIIVTGFDAIGDCDYYTPSVTTVKQDFQRAGEEAVNVLAAMFAGEDTAHNTYVDAMLVKGQSCGCVPLGQTKSRQFFQERYGTLNRYKEFNRYILDLNASFASAENSVQLYKSLEKGAEYFGLKRLYACICSEVEQQIQSYDCDSEQQVCTKISDTMISMFCYGSNVAVGTDFPSKELIPEKNFLDCDHAVIMAFSPLYFKNRILGYLAYEPSKIEGEAGNLFSTWIMSISNNAGSFYMNNELGCVVNELEKLYMRDPLTGLYNRRGMNKLGYDLLDRAKAQDEWVTVICADVDKLKKVNDGYGHEAGDNAITQCAAAIESSVPEDSVCTRTGGDEFCVIISHRDAEEAKKFMEEIYGYLDKYNCKSGLPYKIGCSCGAFSVHSSRLVPLEQMIKAADEKMYKEKAQKKTSAR